MRKHIIAYFLIIALLTGCTVQNAPEQINSTSTLTENSTAIKSAIPSENQRKLPSKTTAQAPSKPTQSSPSKGKYKEIKVDGGDTTGTRKPMVVVDVGYGSREYWAYTNEYGQLIRVTAKKIVLQNPKTEPVLNNGRYYNDEAKVPGTERKDLDEGHVIADSLGGVSNAYNITPQDSTLNRYGDQAYMEKNIRDAGGCTNFEAIITYPNTKTQIPSHYHYTYTLKGNVITEDFDNVNPDKVNKSLIEKTSEKPKTTTPKTSTSDKNHNLDAIDKNHNGKVSIAEAKAAGIKLPITKEHWLYKYMDDRDGDGMVGE
ncbi:DNA/RNA non-specific endonuclease [Ruminiclostridium josui]|uniref:DNA/RNA non-specific endonuclease n=1 Tax=Ruminiclostridium josui TaxID=1499 RepID=UPI000465BD06|nr:DNA/RNA non-specific endonuclease [Ruminiclostridium josui]